MEGGLKKVVIIGPESTGKSTLCEQLAHHYNTAWCPEYAREYLLQHGATYTYPNLLTIAQEQVALEDRTTDSARNGLYFIDTDLYVMKVWCEFVFDKCHAWILDQIARREYDLYLLCKNDLPWIKDELREYPTEGPRERLFHMYKDLMTAQHIPWTTIDGTYEARLQKAINAVDQLLTGR